MAHIHEFDKHLLKQHELLERFAKDEELTDDEFEIIQGIRWDDWCSARERRLRNLLAKGKA